MKTHIFVSHATPDDPVVDHIITQLASKTDVSFWVDHYNLQPPEDNWRIAIHQALHAAAAGLVVLSRHSVQRDEVIAEWHYLLNTERPLYIVKIDDVPQDAIDYRLHLVQWIDLVHDQDAALNGLADALNGKPVRDTTPTVLMRRITGRIERKLLSIPIRGRDYGLWALRTRLAEAPTMILGIGGIGKSRTAAEMLISSEDVNGGIWLNCTSSTTPDTLLMLLRQHMDLSTEANQATILSRLQQQKLLIVLDNAENIPEGEQRRELAALIDELFASGAQVLLTSRSEWMQLDTAKTYRPQQPGLKNAEQIVHDMAQVFDVDQDLSKYATRIAKAARRHPGLIEWAVKQCKRLPPERVMSSLRSLKSKSLKTALDDIVHKTIRQMVRQDGPETRIALDYLVTCQGGFTYEAATELLSNFDDTVRDACLEALVAWQIIRVSAIKNELRYWVADIVLAVHQAAEDAATRHYNYYRALAERCHHDGDYATLVPEIQNLNIARTFDDNFSDWLDRIWSDILEAKTTRR